MLPYAHVLLFGFDPTLLLTRESILLLDGLKVETVQSLRALKESLTARRFDLVVLCHTVPAVERRVAVALAGSLRPAVTALALESLTPVVSSPPIHVMETWLGPQGLRSTVRTLVQSGEPPTRSRDKETEMAFEGTVKWFNNAKGYGFVGRKDGGADVFTHYSSIQHDGYKTLNAGDSVTFEVIQGEKGLQADQVRLSDKK